MLEYRGNQYKSIINTKTSGEMVKELIALVKKIERESYGTGRKGKDRIWDN